MQQFSFLWFFLDIVSHVSLITNSLGEVDWGHRLVAWQGSELVSFSTQIFWPWVAPMFFPSIPLLIQERVPGWVRLPREGAGKRWLSSGALKESIYESRWESMTDKGKEVSSRLCGLRTTERKGNPLNIWGSWGSGRRWGWIHLTHKWMVVHVWVCMHTCVRWGRTQWGVAVGRVPKQHSFHKIPSGQQWREQSCHGTNISLGTKRSSSISVQPLGSYTTLGNTTFLTHTLWPMKWTWENRYFSSICNYGGGEVKIKQRAYLKAHCELEWAL